jgi:hypothetical protein
MKLIVQIAGKPVHLGTIYEDRLPVCTLDDCDERIPLKSVIVSLALGNPTPLYCGRPHAQLAANRMMRERQRQRQERKTRATTGSSGTTKPRRDDKSGAKVKRAALRAKPHRSRTK